MDMRIIARVSWLLKMRKGFCGNPLVPIWKKEFHPDGSSDWVDPTKHA